MKTKRKMKNILPVKIFKAVVLGWSVGKMDSNKVYLISTAIIGKESAGTKNQLSC